jgi:hypothetical protein
METKRIIPENISIAVYDYEGTVLVDKRIRTHGMIFGTIEAVAKQYGIKVEKANGYLKCTAPKNRLQMFVEKLHFSLVVFAEI